MIEIYQVDNVDNLEQARILWREYAEFLKNRLQERAELPSFKEYFKNYEQEIANHLPGRFGPPGGCLLLAKNKGKPAGCVVLLDLGNNICEMRRLFVRPEFRRLGVGRALAKAIVEQGRNMGYALMRLNTNRRMPEADKLYRSLGFGEIEPYEYFEVDGMIFMELKLV